MGTLRRVSGDLQSGLLEFLRRQFGRVSWERLVSGPGITNIYQYLLAAAVAPEQTAVHDEMEKEDPTAVIIRHGLAKTDRLSNRALDLFCEIFGAQAAKLGKPDLYDFLRTVPPEHPLREGQLLSRGNRSASYRA